jgi:hypothetical protein
LNLVFLINLFEDTNVARIFYKLSQTYGIRTNGDSYFGTEEVWFNRSAESLLLFEVSPCAAHTYIRVLGAVAAVRPVYGSR